MRPKDAALIACRVAAIYFAVQAAAACVTLFSIIGEEDVPLRFLVQIVLPPIVYGGAALTLWVAASSVASGMTREAVGDVHPAGLRLRLVHTVAISVAGLVVFVLAVPTLVQLLFEASTPEADLGGRFAGSRGARAGSSLVQLGLGLWLWLGARSIAGALRYEEAPPAPPPARE